jgi:hypothetical protein
MIRSDQELELVRAQLATVESALDSIRRDVYPKNPRTFSAMAESYVATIHELRSAIDQFFEPEYLDDVTRIGNQTEVSRSNQVHEDIEEFQSEIRFVERSGVIRSIDLDAAMFVLRSRSSSQEIQYCKYNAVLECSVKEYFDNPVNVYGTLDVDRQGIKILSVIHIELIAPRSTP